VRRDRRDRGLSTLLSVVTAITVVTITLAGTMVLVEDAFRETARGDAERAVAVQASDRLVAADGPIAAEPNVLDAAELANLSAADLRAVGASERFAIAVRVDDRTVASVGDPDGGTTVRRIALVATPERVERTPALDGSADPRVTLPVRTDAVAMTVEPPPGTTVTAVRSGDRMVLRNASGLSGEFRIDTSPFRTLELAFETTGPLGSGDVTVGYEATRTERVTLAVTVEDRGRREGSGGGSA